jgi:LysR family transcriptional regulator, glycine cleavage system transcriptional activator
MATTQLPDLESLACVDALARTLRFHTAARSRFLSPAAFSKRVQQVEEQLGHKLFLRTTRTVELTPAGVALLPRLRRLLGEAAALSALEGARLPAEVLIGTRHELGMSCLMPARRRLAAALPHVTIHLRFGSTEELERAVLGLRVDAIVTSHAPPTRRLEAMPLWREDYLFVAAPRLLRRLPFRAAEDAAAHTVVDAHDDLPLLSYLRQTGLPLRFARVLTLGTIDAIRAAVRDGEGVAVLPRYFVAADVRARRLVPLLPRTRLGHDWFRLVFRADDPQRALLEEIGRALGRLPLR